MVLHILQNEKPSRGVIGDCRDYCPAEEHPFIVFGGPYSYTFDDFQNVDIFRVDLRDTLRLIRRMKRADSIRFHGLFSFVLICILAFDRLIGAKATWDIYGDDLYCLTKPKKKLSNRLHLWVRRKAYSNLRRICTNVRGDYELACKLLNKRFEYGMHRYSPSYVSGIRPYLEYSCPHDGLNILIGNSATASNHHREALAALEKYKNEEIRVYVPLSYGDKAYAGEITEYGKGLFGEKFVPMTDFMPKDDYFRFLMSIDVAVFANDRQQAMGNIVALLLAGKKLYMRDDTTMWESLHDDYNIRISRYSELATASFDELKRVDFSPEAQKKAVEEMTDGELFRQSYVQEMSESQRIIRRNG